MMARDASAGRTVGRMPCVRDRDAAPGTPRAAQPKFTTVDGPYYAVIGCERCGLAYVSPRPTPDAVARYYADEDRDGWTVRHDEAYAAEKKEEGALRPVCWRRS